MSAIDLDIKNYNLEELLKLFNLPLDFSEKELRGAKAIVLKLHPDKSRLDSRYFIFYSHAYKTICEMWQFKSKTEKKVDEQSTIYVHDSHDESSARKKILNNLFEKNERLKKPENFNKWFNDEFNKMKVNDPDEDGYGDWLRSTDDPDAGVGPMTMGQMKQVFSEKKRQLCSEVVMHSSVQSFQFGGGSGMGCDIVGSGSGNYDSGGGNLVFQDLRKAHTETIIPVDESMLETRPKFNSVGDLNIFRDTQDLHISESEQMTMYNDEKQKESELATIRAYKLSEQSRRIRENSQGFWKGLQLLNDV